MGAIEAMVQSWPRIDRDLFLRARERGSVLEKGGLASEWRPSTVAIRVRAYDRYLAWLKENGILFETETPEQRLTKERVRSYYQYLEPRYSDVTVAMALHSLCYVVRALSKGRKPKWLEAFANRLMSQAEPARPKPPRIVHSRLLYEFGVELMVDALAQGPLTRDAAVRYRDGLMIAMLACCPLRRGEFFALSIDINFRLERSVYVGRLGPEITKSKRPRQAHYWRQLTPYIDRYLTFVRPFLTQGNDSSWLWIRYKGRRMTCAAHRISPLTEGRFRKRVNPQLFRDCAGTSTALDDPEHIGVIPVILGHAQYSTGERYYNQADMISASRRLRDVVMKVQNS